MTMKAQTTPRWFLLIFVSFACVDYSHAVSGGWSNWTGWTTCTFSCSGGTQERTRKCNSPPPADGGATCVGESRETRTCNETPCPITRIACQDNMLHVECSLDGRINVTDALYGRQNSVTCPHSSMSDTNCNFEGTLKWVRKRCQNKAMCDVSHPTAEPCFGTYKYLEVTYVCISVDQCESNPCQNGATCVDGERRYACQCRSGFTGTHCESGINECQSHPCQNGATCSDDDNRYVCSCAAEYTGSLCETDTNECRSNPCHNGATCHDGIDQYNCSCAAGYSGSECEADIDECASSPCQNGATCNDGVNGYTCSCSVGYTDSSCQTDIDECQSSPCQNGATCRDGVNGYTCSCVAGVVGSHCERVLSTQSGRFTILNKDYRKALADKTSDDYKSLAEQVKIEVLLVYTETSYYKHIVAVRDITFSKGSVVVFYKLDLDMAITSESLRQQLKKYVDDHAGYAHTFMINSSSVSFEDAVSSGVVSKQTATNCTTDLPEWSIIAFLTLFSVVILVVIVLVAVIVRRRPERPLEIRRTEDGRREDAVGYSDVGERRWMGAGNMWRKDESWLHKQTRNRDTMREKADMASHNPHYDTRGGSFDDWRLRGNRFRQDSRYVRRY